VRNPEELTAKIREMWEPRTYSQDQVAQRLGCTGFEVYDVLAYGRIRPETTEWAERLRRTL